MAPRRKVIPVKLTGEQRERLERLWFIYGNHGPKTTPGNHAFIQGLLEQGEDIRPLRQRGYIPTEECEQAVDAILSGQKEIRKENSDSRKERRFNLISAPARQNVIRIHPEKENELKELINSLQGGRNHSRAKADDEGNLPPAA